MNLDMNELVKYSDILTAGVGALWANTFNNAKPSTAALQATVVSIIARLIRQQMLESRFTSLTASGKDQLIVGALNGLYAYSKRQSWLKAALRGISIDLISEQVLLVLSIDDKGLMGGSTA